MSELIMGTIEENMLDTITKEVAVSLHREYYKSEDFEVAPIRTKHFLPWNGLISSDGKKCVITKGLSEDIATVDEKWILNLDTDITSVDHKMLSTELKLNGPVEGLSMVKASRLKLIIWPWLGLFPKKYIQLQIYANFGNLEKVNELLDQGDDELQNIN